MGTKASKGQHQPFFSILKTSLLKQDLAAYQAYQRRSPRGMLSSNLLIKNIRVSLNNLRSPLVVWGGVPCQKACPGMLNTNSPLRCGGG